MRELSLNVLDIAENSVRACATLVTISIIVADGILTISIEDNGKGMSKQLLERVTDPFTTTRTTRPVGMGIPLFKLAAEQCEGSFSIASTEGVGTVTTASFKVDHIDRAPLGDLADTLTALVAGSPQMEFVLNYAIDGREFVFDTREVKAELGGVPIEEAEVLSFIKEYIQENITTINGGTVI